MKNLLTKSWHKHNAFNTHINIFVYLNSIEDSSSNANLNQSNTCVYCTLFFY